MVDKSVKDNVAFLGANSTWLFCEAQAKSLKGESRPLSYHIITKLEPRVETLPLP